MRPLPVILVSLLLAALPGRAELRLNEFMASSADPLPGLNDLHDWIELHNSGASAVDLEGYGLIDSVAPGSPESVQRLWRFPAVTIEPGAYLLVLAAGDSVAPVGDYLHAGLRLARAGEPLALMAPDGVTVIDAIQPTYPEQREGVSYGRDADGAWRFYTDPTPGEANERGGVSGFVSDVQFSHERGFFEKPFTVTLSTETPEARIIYTTDGREPSLGTIFTGVVGEEYSGPFEISTTTVLRAVAFKPGQQASANRTQTYLFLDDVLDQPRQPEGFPERWGSRTPDYEMDPEVVGGIYTRAEVKQALIDLPSISLVTDNDNLFANDGIYTNSQAKDNTNTGIDDLWERPVSVEMLGFPHGQTVQANAGIRMQGNASRSPNRVKHNMRLVFRSEYGPGKLRFRMFEDSEVATYNSINLRSNNGDSWIHPGVRQRAQYIRDQWHRVVQRDMGQPYQSQIYAHVYINGLYWGLYHVFERFEASLLAEHWGGEEEDWDALQDTPAFQDIVVNGDDEAYRHTHNLAKEDVSDPAVYQELLEYVDVDNLIDYLLLNFYSGNQDWDHKNMRYARRRSPMEGAVGNGWMFFAWDSERAGLNGLNEQTLTMNNTNKTTNLGPTFLNDVMHAHPDYHLRFADRFVKHCFHGGALTPEGASKSWNDLAQSVYEGLIGESARWGDLHTSRPEAREGNWQSQLDKENEVWFPNRTEVLLGQLAGQGFIDRRPSFPQYFPRGLVSEATEVTLSIFNDSVFNPVQGEILYTMDGTDPRLPDGSINPSARPYDPAAKPMITHSLALMARVHEAANNGWSALGEAWFHLGVLPNKDNLQIHEVHYDPAPPTAEEETAGFNAADFEFIELRNLGDSTVDLSGVQFTRGIRARVDPTAKALLEPGAVALLVANRDAFVRRYPNVPATAIVAVFAEGSRLNNGGEQLTLRNHTGLLLHTLAYDNGGPWPQWEREEGRSLVYTGGVGESAAKVAAWTASAEAGGTPGVVGVGGDASTDMNLAEWLVTAGYSDAGQEVAGQPALLHYAAGREALAEPIPPVSLQVEGETLSHTRRRGANLDWITESSADLRDWQAVTLTETKRESVSPIQERIHWRIPRSEQARYWRLRVRVR